MKAHYNKSIENSGVSLTPEEHQYIKIDCDAMVNHLNSELDNIRAADVYGLIDDFYKAILHEGGCHK